MGSKREINYIVVHCTATPQDTDVDSILDYWHEGLGWENPGYHVILLPEGGCEKLLALDEISNGVKGHNYESINISYIGGVDEKGNALDNRTYMQKIELVNWLTYLRELYPKAEILGHRDLSPDLDGDGEVEPSEWLKECPSFDVRKEYGWI